MASAVRNIVNSYNYLFYELANPISRDWTLVAKPFQLICLLAFYRYFCTKLGPRIMKHRIPFNLTRVMIIYNIFQILLSIYFVVECTRYILFYNFNFKCQGLEQDNATAKWVASGVWTYYMSKISELLDTVFFVLRKSNRQITPLHLHHHTLMPFSAWLSATYYPGGQGILVGYMNSIVHSVMYTYYLVAGLGDEYKKYLWWKKYVTLLQLTQFVIVGIHHINSLFYPCEYLVAFKIMTIFYCFFFMHTFGQFYYDNFIKKAKGSN